jgi:hypothetical protein
MTDLQTLIQAVDELNADELKQLVKHIMETRLSETPLTPKKPRIIGLHAHLGEAWMSDDFRDELPDSFWLGEE